MQPDRRSVLFGVFVLAFPARSLAGPDDPYAASPFRKLTDEEWRKRIKNRLAYAVLRHEATERPKTSALLHEKRPGTYACAGCGLPLFRSTWKYDSRTGWPSFYDHIPGALVTAEDDRFMMKRTAYKCARCLGHHGHVFEDGPQPTGMRYCQNGAALVFIPA